MHPQLTSVPLRLVPQIQDCHGTFKRLCNISPVFVFVFVIDVLIMLPVNLNYVC